MLEVEGAGDLTMERLASLARVRLPDRGLRPAARLPRGGGAHGREAPRQASASASPSSSSTASCPGSSSTRRVLEEATDPTVPLLERLKFAIIVASNLDEFFMVRVAALKNAVEEGDIAPDLAGLTPAPAARGDLGAGARDGGRPLRRRSRTRSCPRSAEHGIRIAAPRRARRAAARRTSPATSGPRCLPALTPLAIDFSRPFPKLASLSLNLAVLLGPARGRGASRGWRWCRCPAAAAAGAARGGDGTTYVLLEEVDPRRAAPRSSRARRCWSPRSSASPATPSWSSTTRAAATTCEAIEEELRKRRRSQVVRLEVEAGVGETLLGRSAERLRGGEPRTSTGSRGPLDMRALLPLVELPALEDLREPPLKPLSSLESARAGATSSRSSTSATSSCTTPTSRSSPWWRSCPRPPTTPTCWPSSRRSTARAATRRSCRPWPAPRRTASRSRCSWSSWPASTSSRTSAGRGAWRRRGPT